MTDRIGKIIALDVGDVRIGIAASDPTGLLATPGGIIRRGPADIQQITEIVQRDQASAILVGLPLNMDGTLGFQAKKVQRFAKLIEKAIAPVPVLFEDERLSTEDARELRLARGTKKKRRQGHVDAEAAAVFLQAWLDRQREQRQKLARSQPPPGHSILPDPAPDESADEP